MVNCSEVVTDSETIVEQKLNYLMQRACHTPQSIVKTKTLSFNYKHIVMRHEILIRSGLFKIVAYNKLHKQPFAIQPRIIRDKYFTPADIVCTNDKSFLRTCTNNSLSLNELVAFEEVFEANYEKWGLGEDEEYHTDDSGIDTFIGRDDRDSETGKGPHRSDAASFFNEKDMSEFYY